MRACGGHAGSGHTLFFDWHENTDVSEFIYHPRLSEIITVSLSPGRGAGIYRCPVQCNNDCNNDSLGIVKQLFAPCSTTALIYRRPF